MQLPKAIADHIEKNSAILKNYSEKLAGLYRNCYASTARTALKELEDGSLFVLTGDIPAMWLRDSSAQVNHYIELADDSEVADLIARVIKKQFSNILKDPYANAFNEAPNGRGMTDDLPKNDPWVWERKYEVDSLCYPIRLLYRYWKRTGDDSIVKNEFLPVMKTILKVWKTEQHHVQQSPYRFFRKTDNHNDTIHNNGMGEPVGYTGMTWSGFRPSDDGCTYGYYIPSNMFATVVLGYAAEMLAGNEITEEILMLKKEIENGIEQFAIVEHPKFGKVYACEVDGLGHYRLMDDANIPSLISIPYIGYRGADSKVYENTRKLLLSRENPYYFEGKYARGIGSPHTPDGYIWHMALSMQGLTSKDPAEMKEILGMLENADADTGFMHEGFCADDPTKYTREWFTWSDSIFCEFVECCMEKGILG